MTIFNTLLYPQTSPYSPMSYVLPLKHACSLNVNFVCLNSRFLLNIVRLQYHEMILLYVVYVHVLTRNSVPWMVTTSLLIWSLCWGEVLFTCSRLCAARIMNTVVLMVIHATQPPPSVTPATQLFPQSLGWRRLLPSLWLPTLYVQMGLQRVLQAPRVVC